MGFDEHFGRSSTLEYPAPYGPVLRNILKYHNFAIFGRSPQK